MAGTGPPPHSERQRAMFGTRKRGSTAGKKGSTPGRKGPARGIPVCPKWLDAEAKKCWRATVKQLDELGVLTELDHAILTAFCTAWSNLQDATALIAKDGLTTTCGTGGTKRHPAVAIAADARQALRLLGDSLGLTPIGRKRLGYETASARLALSDDPFERLLMRDRDDDYTPPSEVS